MGLRTTRNLQDSDHEFLAVEVSDRGKTALREMGVEAVSAEEAIPRAEIVVLALPDNLIGPVCRSIESLLQPGTMLVALDPAAPFAGVLPERDDLIYFVTHPCHPPVVNDETDPEAKMDFFGGIKAKQHIVCALMQGPEEAYGRGEEIARRIFQPVMRAHRVTVEQMAMLEPALSETVVCTLMTTIGEAIDEAVDRGVPRQAAVDFILGHINVSLGIVFGFLPGGTFSDGAKKAIEQGKKDILQPDWRKVFEPEAIRRSIEEITRKPD